MPSVYNDNFRYSKFTSSLANFYPSWMQIRKNRESIGHQFLNVFGLQLEEIERFLNEAINNQFIKTANLGEIYELHKFFIPDYWDSSTKILSVTGFINNEEFSFIEAPTVRQFYEIDNGIIFDFDNHVAYIKPNASQIKYSRLLIKTDIENMEFFIDELFSHHVWNVFDEFALLLGLERRFVLDQVNSTSNNKLYKVEDNASLKERILNVFRFPASSTRLGLLHGIGQSLGLIGSQAWPENLSQFSLEGSNAIHADTIIINGKKPLLGQIKCDGEDIFISSTIAPSVADLSKMTLNNLVIIKDKLMLAPGFSQGSLITDAFYPSNLKHWDSIYIDGTGNISVEVLAFDYDSFIESSSKVFYKGSYGLGEIGHLQIDTPIRLRISFKRESKTAPSPELTNVSLSFVNESAEIKYVHSLKINELHDEEFKKSLFNNDGSASTKIKAFSQELSEVSPILWDDFVWDEAYWDVVEKNLMGLDALPHIWDPYLSEKAAFYMQNGIGDNNDLLVGLTDDWKLKVHNGFFYLGNSRDESYLFSSPVSVTANDTNQVVLKEVPKQGSPVIVKTEDGYLTQVSFLDDDFNFSLRNTESVIADGSKEFYLSYKVSNIESVSSGTVVAINNNKITLDIAPKAGEEITFVYSLPNSFVVQDNVVKLSSFCSDVEVIYEGQDKDSYYTVETLSLDPVVNHITSGFIYLADKVEPVDDLVIRADPDLVMATGLDIAVIVVDVIDKYKNPVLNTDINAETSAGSITLSAQHYNRFIYRFVAPLSQEDCIVTFSTDNGRVSRSIIIKAR